MKKSFEDIQVGDLVGIKYIDRPDIVYAKVTAAGYSTEMWVCRSYREGRNKERVRNTTFVSLLSIDELCNL